MQEYIRDGGLKLEKNSSFVYSEQSSVAHARLRHIDQSSNSSGTIQQVIEASYASSMAQSMRKSTYSSGPTKFPHVKKLAAFWCVSITGALSHS